MVGLHLDVTARTRYRLFKIHHVTHVLRHVRHVQRILALDNQIPLVRNRAGITVESACLRAFIGIGTVKVTVGIGDKRLSRVYILHRNHREESNPFAAVSHRYAGNGEMRQFLIIDNIETGDDTRKRHVDAGT